MSVDRSITKSSSAEYFSKNLQQVGFSSFTKATLTTIKEAVDNSLDACEDHGILPEIFVSVQRLGEGTTRGADLVKVVITDNGPGLTLEDAEKVFGQYLASSKFGRGRCS
ncbi:MAG TPA: ATP-binding protein, partial [bacterium]|nr:ATP-binding protein [bacterium]